MRLAARRVGPDEVAELHVILRACGLDMKARLGLGHWDPPYPLHLLRRDAQDKEVYAVADRERGDRSLATFTLGTQPPPYYDAPAPWAAPAAHAAYLTRLAVLPTEQARGIGRRCVALAEALARERGCAFLRLDVHGGHTGLAVFYERLGYEPRGTVAVRSPDADWITGQVIHSRGWGGG